MLDPSATCFVQRFPVSIWRCPSGITVGLSLTLSSLLVLCLCPWSRRVCRHHRLLGMIHIKSFFKNTLISLQEYNFILLYIMAWIIWCLTYDYVFHFDASILILFFISLKKGIYSLSLSPYIYIIYSFLINQCIFVYNTILD